MLLRSAAAIALIVGTTLAAVQPADAVLKDVCKYVGVDKSDCDKIFFGVRTGGWTSFRKKRVAWRPR